MLALLVKTRPKGYIVRIATLKLTHVVVVFAVTFHLLYDITLYSKALMLEHSKNRRSPIPVPYVSLSGTAILERSGRKVK